MQREALVRRYARMALSDDLLTRRVALAQLRQLRPKRRYAERETAAVDLVQVIAQTIGPLQQRPSGEWEGSCPLHVSKSGRTLVIFDNGQRWWCRSCLRGGDAVGWLVQMEDITVAEARRRLGRSARR